MIEKDMEALKSIKKKNEYPSYRDLDSRSLNSLYSGDDIEWDKVESVVVRLDKVKIKNIKEPFWDRKGEINVVTMVLDDLPYNLDQENPMNILFFGTFEDIKKGDTLPIEHPLLYSVDTKSTGKVPDQLVLKFLVTESDRKKRYAGEILEKIKNTDEYKRVLEALSKYPKPEIGLITLASDVIFSIIAKTLKMERDDQLLLTYAGFHKYIEKLGFGRHRALNENAEIEYSIHLPPYKLDVPIIGENYQ